MSRIPFAKAVALAILGSILAVGAVYAQAPAPVSQAVSNASPDYHLGSGDKVRVTVFGEADLTGEYAVSAEGKISMPLIGPVKALGLTVDELKQGIASALMEGYIKEPRVSVEILNFRPFYILGEVNRPGEYPYTAGLTLERAVATASGYTYRANQKKVYIKRATDEKESAVNVSGIVVVQPGDTIRIPERYF